MPPLAPPWSNQARRLQDLLWYLCFYHSFEHKQVFKFRNNWFQLLIHSGWDVTTLPGKSSDLVLWPGASSLLINKCSVITILCQGGRMEHRYLHMRQDFLFTQTVCLSQSSFQQEMEGREGGSWLVNRDQLLLHLPKQQETIVKSGSSDQSDITRYLSKKLKIPPKQQNLINPILSDILFSYNSQKSRRSL